jgi:hypothetical protein
MRARQRTDALDCVAEYLSTVCGTLVCTGECFQGGGNTYCLTAFPRMVFPATPLPIGWLFDSCDLLGPPRAAIVGGIVVEDLF